MAWAPSLDETERGLSKIPATSLATAPTRRLAPRRLADIESAAQEALRGNLLEQTWGRKALELVREVRALKRDVDTADVLQRLYDSEINARIEWVWDGGVQWRLGDASNGYGAEGRGKTVAEAFEGLANAAARLYPASAFAAWWRRTRSADA